MESNTQFLADGTAYRLVNSQYKAPFGVTYIHGLKSDMLGAKADAVGNVCTDLNLPYLRYDVLGHGQSQGDFMDFSVTKAVKQATYVINTLTQAPQILIGSSMGGWISLKLLQDKLVNAAGFIGIAASADFTQRYAEKMTDTQQHTYNTLGYYDIPSPYSDEGYRFSRFFIEDSRAAFFLNKPCAFDGPVHLIQAVHDELVPNDMPEKIAGCFSAAKRIVTTRINGADHRLARDCDLIHIRAALRAMAETLAQTDKDL